MKDKPEFDGPEEYDETAFERPSVTVDLTIFTVDNNELKALLVKRSSWPFEGSWALPGGFIDMDESLEEAAERTLHDKTGLTENIYLEQLYTFGKPERDPRTRVITVGYLAMVNADEIETGSLEDSEEVEWMSVYSRPELAFDHDEILDYAVKRLRWKLEYTTAAFSFLSEKFTLSDLQNTYETVFDKEFDKRNFRKKIRKNDLVEYTGEKEKNVSHRPAKLYRANKEIGEIVDIL